MSPKRIQNTSLTCSETDWVWFEELQLHSKCDHITRNTQWCPHGRDPGTLSHVTWLTQVTPMWEGESCQPMREPHGLSLANERAAVCQVWRGGDTGVRDWAMPTRWSDEMRDVSEVIEVTWGDVRGSELSGWRRAESVKMNRGGRYNDYLALWHWILCFSRSYEISYYRIS